MKKRNFPLLAVTPATPSVKTPLLLANEKVEVRSLEEGFRGSWHTAKIIDCQHLSRLVQYDFLLSDDGSGNLVEYVSVSPAIGGVVNGKTVITDTYRGVIRPLPPPSMLKSSYLHYGQCVDLFYKDAWWEGVVFDHDGCEKRRIFFPDMGDEMEGCIDKLRISQDWDEVTGEWKPRKNWTLLELIEEVEEKWPLPVSVKQIWYEVRGKSGFHDLREWISVKRHVWRDLVFEVISDNFKITVKHILNELNFYPQLEFSEPKLDDVLGPEMLLKNYLGIGRFAAAHELESSENTHADVESSRHCQVLELNNQVNLEPAPIMIDSEEAPSVSAHGSQIFTHSADEASRIGIDSKKRAPGKTLRSTDTEATVSKKINNGWRPVVSDLVPGAEFCPNAIAEIIEIYKLKNNRRPSRHLITKARQHLLHMGWIVDHRMDGINQKLRYLSPEGKLFYSLPQVVLHVGEAFVSSSQTLSLSPINSNNSLVSSPLVESSPSSCVTKLRTPRDLIAIEPEYCPEAVNDYLQCPGKCSGITNTDWTDKDKDKVLKARKHLSAIGWAFYYHERAAGPREMRYVSPRGKTCNSLRAACKWLVECGDYEPAIGGTETVNCIESCNELSTVNGSNLPLIAMEHPENLLNSTVEKEKSMEVQVHKTEILGKRKNQESKQLFKRGAKSHEPRKVRGDVHGDSLARVRRSCKRAREVVASSHPNPRTILSWLIDNNVVLPRAKVCYRNKKDGRSMKEGRITREGIKCSCCQKIWTLSNFEAHAGSNYHRPSANIFLEDGRSLTDCQSQLNQQKGKSRSSRSDDKTGYRYIGTNDYICSFCHVGGELVMCDRCPSSFHMHCLGLKEIPEGDLFCPSCCCGICGLCDFGNTSKHLKQSPFLVCSQCEHQFHVGCLEAKGMKNMKSQPEGNWFCSDSCEKILYGLCKSLGKPIPLGIENMTWTLVKHIKSDSSDYLLENNNSKLHVALSVMHECFEPLKEPGSRNDLVEDVIFCRGSNLKRLNFQGFYTVLLENKDELVSAATVRIFGKKVAEVPLVATRFQYRRLGMCRVLMNQLEKKLKELGVERLVLPAIPSVLNTWTTSFGFSVLNESERLNFLDYTFLGFQDTIVCQKFLTSAPSSTLSLSTGTREINHGDVNKTVDIELDRDSMVSEVSQADQLEEIGIVEQESTSIEKGTDENNGSDSSQVAATVDQPSPLNCLPFHLIESPDSLVGISHNKQDEDSSGSDVKCYKRRKVSTC